MFINFIKTAICKIVLATGLLASLSIFAMPAPASADTRSTAAIVAAAALVIGAIAYDNSGRPYYVRGGRRWFVSRDVASYWRYHRVHRGYRRFPR